ncbi:MAG: NAD(P)/FAD-dependent oxidoreductase [Moraxellaceae bacterium]|nr:MAG: NAD(P)/FAD-dependent oxidoreductase [Moraxellaceae bacterium]
MMANGDMGFEFGRLIHNWSINLTLFTNGKSTLTNEQLEKLKHRNVAIIEREIKSINHQHGQMQQLVFTDGSTENLDALFAKIPFKQHCEIPEQLGCALTEQGFVVVDEFQKTTVPGMYAAGDITTMFRTLSAAIGAGTKAGAMLNHELVSEEF